jgi:thiol-disulfide isomerase/thioredoxin
MAAIGQSPRSGRVPAWVRHTVAALLVSGTLVAAGDRVPAASAQDKDQQHAEEVRQGEALLQRRQFEPALQAFKRASALRNKTSAAAHFGMARAYFGLGAYKNAIESSNEGLKHAGDDRRLEALLRNHRGISLVAFANRPDGKADETKLKDAEADFRAVLALGDSVPIASYNLGVALLKLNRDAEGVQALKAFVDRGLRVPEVAQALRMIENPRRAREFFAPDFSVTTLQGEYLALEDLKGKVVLLDFWATWCGPCLVATPSLIRLNKKLAAQPFVMIGVSADRSQEPWQRYVVEKKLDWPQYFDQGRRLAGLFQVRGYPTYLVLDAEGVVRFRHTGWGSNTEQLLESEIKRALKSVSVAAQNP